MLISRSQRHIWHIEEKVTWRLRQRLEWCGHKGNLAEAGKGKKGFLPLRASRKCNPIKQMLNFWYPQLWGNTFLLFWTLNFAIIHYSSHSKVTQYLSQKSFFLNISVNIALFLVSAPDPLLDNFLLCAHQILTLNIIYVQMISKLFSRPECCFEFPIHLTNSHSCLISINVQNQTPVFLPCHPPFFFT